MCHRLLGDASFHRHLGTIDADLAARTKGRRCPSCQGVLHAANYPRKPRGVAAEVEGEYELRHSFCCGAGNCRKRLTPTSVRFLDRRVYVGVVVVLAAVMAHGLNRSRCRRLCGELGVDPRTLARWREWWQESVPRTDFWTELRARLDRPVDPSCLPASLLERMVGEGEEQRLLAFLGLVAPLSHSVLMRTRSSRVA